MKGLPILLCDDEEVIVEGIGGYLRDLGHPVDTVGDGLAAIERIEAREYGLALVDVRMPGADGLTVLERARELRPELLVVLITGHGTMDTVIDALRAGAADFLNKPIKIAELDAVIAKASRLRGLEEERARLRQTIGDIQTRAGAGQSGERLIGRSPAMDEVRRLVAQAVEAGCDTVLITGETGAGKELIARELHFSAHAPDRPFIAVSCPALPDSLVESELFGHVKGAFTGATESRAGCFELAHGGTLFLDEVGDLSTAAQAKLLRVLEARKVRRVGGSKEISVDIRLIAATNVDLDELVKRGDFRNDLFYRLDLFEIHVPPLRRRRADIEALAQHFLDDFRTTRRRPRGRISADAMQVLRTYDYPGNVRELRNIVERAAILAGDGPIETRHLALGRGTTADDAPPTASPAVDAADESERARVVAVLERVRWNRAAAARELGISYSALRHRLAKLGIA